MNKLYASSIGVIAIVLVAIIIGVYYWGKSAGADDIAPEIPGEQQPDGRVVNKPLTDAERKMVNDLATRLKDDIYSMMGGVWRDSEAYILLRDLSDRLFVAVSNQYKEIADTNLFADIQDETSFNPNTVDATRIIINRAKQLNLL